MDAPRMLYKYRSLTRQEDRDHTRELIVDRKLYFACVDDFNDPFDCQAYLVVRRGTPAAWKKLGFAGRVPRDVRERYMANSGPRTVRRVARNLGIFCSTPNPLSIPMWSYYTHGHTGICVGFRTTEASDSPIWDSQQVEYSDEYPAYDPLLDDGEAAGKQTKATLLRKSTAWQHESEWRAFNTDGPGVVEYGPYALAEVVLGCRIPAERRDEILGWVAECGRPVKVLQARQHDREYRLELEVVQDA